LIRFLAQNLSLKINVVIFMNLSQKSPVRKYVSLLFAGTIVTGSLWFQPTQAFSLDIMPPQVIKPVPIEPAPRREVIEAIQADLARNFDIKTPITVLNFSVQAWPDGCLGLPRGKEGCLDGVVPGWRIEVNNEAQIWTYRTDTKGNILRLESSNRTLPPKIAQALLKRVAKDTRVGTKNLKITEVKPTTFNGCLGIYRPNQACTMIALFGWQVIVTTPRNSFVYHLTQDGSQIVQNPTASGAGKAVRVSFEQFGGPIAPAPRNVVFQSVVFGGFAGIKTTIALTDDGKITEFREGPTVKFKPIVRKTLTPKQLEDFQKALENRRFPNLNGLSYLTAAALADYPTTTYQTQYATTQFIDLEKKRLPRSLQQVINNWETLIQR
jgi:hypothetical protein